jgi:hypothetical protein
MQSWPYFRSRASRNALKASEPVPVASCWNGIGTIIERSCLAKRKKNVITDTLTAVFMDASPFYSSTTRPLRFRGASDSLAEFHLEGSECCLIHTDNPLSASKGVWLNPSVRVGYNAQAYDAVHSKGSRANTWVGTASVLHGSWENRILRWFTTTWFEESTVRKRIRNWRRSATHDSREEGGAACLVNEMQVLVSNGWAHV